MTNGAESVVTTMRDAGVTTYFANPGTSEMHLVDALDRVPGVRAVLTLFEGVATGAADGYARMAGLPGATLLHLGPGLANGLANLHNANKARTPVVNVIGNHATTHQRFEAPLTADVHAFARTVSDWVVEPKSVHEAGAAAARAVQAARNAPGQVSNLILPADVAWADGAHKAAALAPNPAGAVHHSAVDATVKALRAGPVALLLRGPALQGEGLRAAGRIAAATGATLFSDTFAPRIERGAGRVRVARLPYRAEAAVEALREFGTLVLVGTQAPIAFFAYPDTPSELTPAGTRLVTLAHPHEDGPAALQAVADVVARHAQPLCNSAADFDVPEGPLTAWAISQVVASLLPAESIVSDEGVTGSMLGYPLLDAAAPHDVLHLTGGAIGDGLPVATGAAIACPDRPVVCLEGDGSALYTIQSLWTQARERLNVTTVIYANRSYRVLEDELHRVGGGSAGAVARSMLDLTDPTLDFVALAQGMGVGAVRASTVQEFEAAFREAVHTSGPALIEAVY